MKMMKLKINNSTIINMKKVTVAFLMFFMIGAAKAQDFKKVQTFFILNKFEDARKELDKILADPKTQTNADAQLWKARIYGVLFADSASRSNYPQSGVMSLNAFKNYMSLDPENKKLKDAGMGVIDQLYVTNFNLGRNFFDREMWDSSLTYFKQSHEMGNYITQKNWRNNKQAIDTFTVLFTAYAAQNSKKLDEAAMYYRQFADLKIGGQPYESVYDFLGRHYLSTKNSEMFNKYVGIAKELYPANTLWKSLESAYVEDNMTLTEKLKMYDDGVASGSMTSEEYFNYGSMFANVSKEDAKSLDSMQIAAIKKKAGAAFIKAFELDPKNGLAAYNAGVILNNEWNELQERYRENVGASPAQRAKREEIDKTSLPVATNAVEWMEKAFGIFDAKTDKNKVEKNSYSTSIKILANLYEFKRDKAKGKSPADYDKFDKKFNFYAGKVGS
jgi:hypothetical protein